MASSVGGGELNRMLLSFYVMDDTLNWQFCEVDLEEGEDDAPEIVQGSSPLIRCALKPSPSDPNFAIMGSTMFAVVADENGCDSADYTSAVQSFDIGNAISSGWKLDIPCPDSTYMPEPLIAPLLFVYQNKLYVFGRPASTSPTSVIAAAVLDPSKGSWEKLDAAPGNPHMLSYGNHSIYPAYIQGNMVVLTFRGSVYLFNLDTRKWNVEHEDYYLPNVSFYRNRLEQALVMGDFLYTLYGWDETRDLMSLRAYDLKEKIWVDYEIMQPFEAHTAHLSQIGEKTICIVASRIFTKLKCLDTTNAYCIKVDLDTSVDQNTGCIVVKVSNQFYTKRHQYGGMLYCCLPFPPEIAKNKSIHHNGNKRPRKLTTGDLDFTS